MTVKRIVTPEKFIGLSTDTKSTHCRSGATFYEYDTDLFFITYDEGAHWVIKRDATNEGAWTFGQPVLRCAGAGKVGWIKDTGNTEALFQKGTSGYLANLYGGAQTGTDWAAVYIPVNELPVPAFESALWTYRLTSAESAGVNLVVWVHDPTDNMKRAEITQVMGLVDHADGWNGHELDTSVSQFFFNGEGTDDAVVSGTTTWDAFQADVLFSTWAIYRISLEYGWIGSGTLDDAWVADVKLNGQIIPLIPSTEEMELDRYGVWQTITIDNTLSGVADLGRDYEMLLLELPEWTYAKAQVYVSRTIDGTYWKLTYDGDLQRTGTTANGGMFIFTLGGFRFIKIEASESQSSETLYVRGLRG